MTPDQMALFIPITAIIGGVSLILARMSFTHEERKAQIKAQNQGFGNESLRGELQRLNDEMARLRDTSTQYDISIQHTLEDLQQRVAKLESRRSTGVAIPSTEEAQQATAAINRH